MILMDGLLNNYFIDVILNYFKINWTIQNVLFNTLILK